LKLSVKGKYSTRMLLELAINYGKGPTLLKEICSNQELPQKYLGQLVTPLKIAGFISSSRGAHGGYLLKRHPKNITLYDIITSVEGSINPSECIDNPDICERFDTCVTQEVWAEIGQKCSQTLRSYTLQDLVERHFEKQGSKVRS
jgi:Rrf2 family protein